MNVPEFGGDEHSKAPEIAGPLPGWLFVATEQGVPLPVDTRLQELPFGRLTWTNFERLCYRLARGEADIECCRIHGEAGHDQIDLFAQRARREKWTVYQCKRVKDFGPARIAAAVREFLGGSLVTRTETFVLCTSKNLRSPKCMEEIEKQRIELHAHSVKLEIWDALELNAGTGLKVP
jgi:hypothetical protein